MMVWAQELTLLGKIVLMPNVFGHADHIELTDEQKSSLDHLHKRKIDLADRVFVVDPGAYIGESTQSEISYARRKDKAIDYVSDLENCGAMGAITVDRATLQILDGNHRFQGCRERSVLPPLRFVDVADAYGDPQSS
jgi:hypothetical protein